jgi:uncharacterized membrane protein
MKTTTTLLLLICFNVLSSFGQNNLELSLKKDTEAATTENVHVYVIEVKNVSNTTETFNLKAQNTPCKKDNVSLSKKNNLLVKANNSEVKLIQELLQKNQSKLNSNSLTLRSGESREFNVKISRPSNTKLNTWNCTEIIAQSQNKGLSSNPLIIKTQIPNPKDFN